MAADNVTDYDSYIHEPNNTKLSHIPGDDGLPLIGHTIRFLSDPFVWAREQYRKHGSYLTRLNQLGGKGVVALGPDLVQQVLLDPGRDFSSKMGFMDRVATFFDGSLIMEDFEHHKHQRRIMQTAFKNAALQHYTAEINRIYERALHEWEADAGTTISFYQYIKNLLLEVAAEIFIGETERGERVRKLNQAFIDCSNGTLYIIPVPIPGLTLYKGLEGKKYLKKFFRDLVPQKRDGNGLDMLSHFCRERDEEGNLYSDEEIADQTMFLLLAAHDTTTAAITHTIHYLARHTDVKERLYQECRAIGKERLDYEDLDRVPYMQQVFHEVLRLRPSAPIVPRRTIRDVDMAGHRVPAHTMVYTIPRFNHHLEHYWKDPFTFDPDRFSPERAEHKQHPFLYHPFGGGAHKCIGMHFSQMEYKCFLYQFLRKYAFEARHGKEPKMLTLPIPKPADGMPVELTLR